MSRQRGLPHPAANARERGGANAIGRHCFAQGGRAQSRRRCGTGRAQSRRRRGAGEPGEPGPSTNGRRCMRMQCSAPELSLPSEEARHRTEVARWEYSSPHAGMQRGAPELSLPGAEARHSARCAKTSSNRSAIARGAYKSTCEGRAGGRAGGWTARMDGGMDGWMDEPRRPTPGTDSAASIFASSEPPSDSCLPRATCGCAPPPVARQFRRRRSKCDARRRAIASRSTSATCRDWAHPVPHLRRDCAHPSHICARTGRAIASRSTSTTCVATPRSRLAPPRNVAGGIAAASRRTAERGSFRIGSEVSGSAAEVSGSAAASRRTAERAENG
jgi:hypothetical protein